MVAIGNTSDKLGVEGGIFRSVLALDCPRIRWRSVSPTGFISALCHPLPVSRILCPDNPIAEYMIDGAGLGGFRDPDSDLLL